MLNAAFSTFRLFADQRLWLTSALVISDLGGHGDEFACFLQFDGTWSILVWVTMLSHLAPLPGPALSTNLDCSESRDNGRVLHERVTRLLVSGSNWSDSILLTYLGLFLLLCSLQNFCKNVTHGWYMYSLVELNSVGRIADEHMLNQRGIPCCHFTMSL